jgi:hypothetical protein
LTFNGTYFKSSTLPLKNPGESSTGLLMSFSSSNSFCLEALYFPSLINVIALR